VCNTVWTEAEQWEKTNQPPVFGGGIVRISSFPPENGEECMKPKRITTLFFCAVLLLTTTACQTSATYKDTQGGAMYAVHHQGATLALGQTRQDAMDLCGEDEKIVADFEEEFVERVEYWDDFEEIQFDYALPHDRLEKEKAAPEDDPYIDPEKPNDPIASIRFKTSDWSLPNGLTVGSSSQEVKDAFKKFGDYLILNNSGYSIAFDADMKAIKYDLYAPRTIDIRIKEGVVSMIILTDNDIKGFTGQGSLTAEDIAALGG